MKETLEFIAGMFVGYLILSPRLRAWTVRVLVGYVVYLFPKLRAKLEEHHPIEILEEPRIRTSRRCPRTPDVNGAGQLEVDTETLEEYLKNPDVSVRL